MVATLNQPQYQPWPIEEQVVAIYAGINGYLDEIPTAQVPRFQEELREHLRTEKSIYQQIRDNGELPGRAEREAACRGQEVQRTASSRGRRPVTS